MATATASKPALRSTAGTYDHVFFSAMAILMAITVFVGFAHGNMESVRGVGDTVRINS